MALSQAFSLHEADFRKVSKTCHPQEGNYNAALPSCQPIHANSRCFLYEFSVNFCIFAYGISPWQGHKKPLAFQEAPKVSLREGPNLRKICDAKRRLFYDSVVKKAGSRTNIIAGKI